MPEVKQTAAPLHAEPLLNPVNCPANTLAPWNTKQDLYSEGWGSLEKSGLIRNAPHQRGEWFLEPFYNGLLPTVVCATTGEMFTKCLYRMAHDLYMSDPADHIAKVATLPSWPKEVKWVHTLRGINTTVSAPNRMYGTSLLVVDIIVPNMSYGDRRKIIEAHFEPLGIRLDPFKRTEKAMAVPRFAESEAESLWAGLHLQNQEFATPLYGGIVAKRKVSPYLFQTEKSYPPYLNWMYHPFDCTT